jgi:hypothetical protein
LFLGTVLTAGSTKNQAHLKEKSRPSPSLSPVKAAIGKGLPLPPAGDCFLSPALFSKFFPTVTINAVLGSAGSRLSVRKDRMVAALDGVARKSANDVEEVQAEPRKGFFVRFMDAVRETRRHQACREIAKNAHLLSDDARWQLDLWRN